MKDDRLRILAAGMAADLMMSGGVLHHRLALMSKVGDKEKAGPGYCLKALRDELLKFAQLVVDLERAGIK